MSTLFYLFYFLRFRRISNIGGIFIIFHHFHYFHLFFHYPRMEISVLVRDFWEWKRRKKRKSRMEKMEKDQIHLCPYVENLRRTICSPPFRLKMIKLLTGIRRNIPESYVNENEVLDYSFWTKVRKLEARGIYTWGVFFLTTRS